MKKEEGEEDIVGDSAENDVRDNSILEPLHSQELLSSVVSVQACYVPRGAASVQASSVPREACRGHHTAFGLSPAGASYVPREDTDSGGSTKYASEKQHDSTSHAIDIDERTDMGTSSTENEGENSFGYKWIMPETMLMEKNNRTWICQLESYEKQNIKEGEEVKLKIQKVPAILRGVKSNEECYDPMIVAIGPYHHNKDELQQMETFKIQFTLQYADQSGKSIRKLYEEMQNSLVEAKNYYTEDVAKKFNDKKFAEMLFLDSCFVIQFMDSCVNPKNNDIKTTNIDTAFIMRDIMLLENQLPFKILTKLMCLSLRFEGGKGFEMIDDFIKLIMKDPPIEEKAPRRKTCFYFSRQNLSQKELTEKREKPITEKREKPIHLLELVQTKFVDETEIENSIIKEDPSAEKKAPRRKSCVWFREPNHMATCSMQVDVNREIKSEASDKPPLYWCLYRSVKELKSVGIHFRPSETCRFSDIKFNSGHLYGWLKLPRITIEDGTKSLLLNLVAFEACADTLSNFGVSSYVYFMDTLIDHAEDVKKLRSKGIILNLLGNDEQVAELFNEISENLVPDLRVFGTVKKSLDAFYKSRRRLWLTECWRNHFRSPWAIIAFLAAIVVVCLTITQTVFSAIQL